MNLTVIVAAILCLCCCCSQVHVRSHAGPETPSDNPCTPLIVAHYGEEYADFYRGRVDCDALLGWQDVIVDTVTDIEVVSAFSRIAWDLREIAPVEGANVDVRLCVEVTGDDCSAPIRLSIGWNAVIMDSAFVFLNHDPIKRIWYPFCQLDEHRFMQMDSVAGAYVLQILPDGYLGGSLLDVETRLQSAD